MFKIKTQCRCCHGYSLASVFSLGAQPLANNFVGSNQQTLGSFPLTVMFCLDCTMSQLSVVVDPEVLYSNYCYVTSTSTTMKNHFELLWELLNQKCPMRRIVEFGSNDGKLLDFFLQKGAEKVCGIDPALNLVPKEEQNKGSVCGMFNQDTARVAKYFLHDVDLVIARHVFGHIDDLDEVMKGLDILCGPETVVAIEVPYVEDMLSRAEFDTIYHEHLSYFSLMSIKRLADRTGFVCFDVKFLDIHGGAMLVLLKKASDNPSGWILNPAWCKDNISEEMDWRNFRSTCEDIILKMRDTVDKLNGMKKSIYGLGASAKSTVWLNACGLSNRDIRAIGDCTPQKIGLYSPGTGIPIIDEKLLLLQKPDAIIIFAWNFADEIIKRYANYIAEGGLMIYPRDGQLHFVDKNGTKTYENYFG